MTPKPSFDPGLTQQYTGPILRSINKDGSFNVRRRGMTNLAGNFYMLLVTMSWNRFFSVVAFSYIAVNFIFAGLYMTLPDGLHPTERDLQLPAFGRAFFFSVQTLTTVGYGSIYPYGFAAHMVAALEAALGLMVFALATGLLFARFSLADFAFGVRSETMVVAPYRDTTAIEFRLANARPNVLMNVHADMMLTTVEAGPDGRLRRSFTELALERNEIFFLALTWTVVHPITDSSPLWGKTQEDLKRLQAEILILIKGYDDSFSQEVHTRYSYRWDETDWSAKFSPAFEVAPEGHIVLDLGKVSATARVDA